MLLKWLPWKFIATHLARSKGFLDPIDLLARLQSFAQPSEVDAPMELLRAGMVLHARGLINTKVIQQNLDWVWPYWVQQQFDPASPSFLPRAFNITHINLTHRNWTAVGLPGCQAMPIVDPRGMVTPFFDGWSLDAWLIPEDAEALLPSTLADEGVEQQLDTQDTLAVRTRLIGPCGELRTCVHVTEEDGRLLCNIDCNAEATCPGWLVFSVRPFNPEGVSFISSIRRQGPRSLTVDGKACIEFTRDIDLHAASRYHKGDVFLALPDATPCDAIHCDVGLASSAAMFRLDASHRADVTARVDLVGDTASEPLKPEGPTLSWPHATEGLSRLSIPDAHLQNLYDAAVRSLILLTPQDPYPGPFTYKRFWFRDAVYLLHALACIGDVRRVREALKQFPDRQSLRGYFHSQQGEWDSNGEVLWFINRYETLTNSTLPESWTKVVRKAIRWIQHKRVKSPADSCHVGLMPAGFSAEHLGNNDYYYWDDYWSVAGLYSAGEWLERRGLPREAQAARSEGEDMMHAIDRSLARSKPTRDTVAIPASPHRRMDAGAVGSLVAGYPTGLLDACDERLLATADWLRDNCMVRDAFFQDMIHSGRNAYLTLHLAQVYLRAGRMDYWPLVQAVAEMASPTGQWPEAVHPQTGGGCMGDGQHAWAAADWVLMIRNLFVREEGEALWLASGVPPAWLVPGATLAFGPTLTRFGPMKVTLDVAETHINVRWHGTWHTEPTTVNIGLPGYPESHVTDPARREVTLSRHS